MNLYLTADSVGLETGGGLVTENESQALRSLGDCAVISRAELAANANGKPEPWCWDEAAVGAIHDWRFRLVHGYAGTFGQTVRVLKERGAKVSWCIAAHDRFKSRKAHEELGIPFSKLYPHLCEEDLWNRYISAYRSSDVLVCPSEHSADIVRSYGQCDRVTVIPHGCTLPERTVSQPSRFIVGYLGSVSAADKGVRYLLAAWKRLAYTDATLVLAGRDSCHSQALIQAFGGGAIVCAGWQKTVSEFYNRISVFCAPAVTEGFNLEVLESMAHARPAIVSTGAGACDLVPEFLRFPAGDVDALCERIEASKKTWDLQKLGADCKRIAERHTWDAIKERYKEVWRSLL